MSIISVLLILSIRELKSRCQQAPWLLEDVGTSIFLLSQLLEAAWVP
jgi:hypothetical protein